MHENPDVIIVGAGHSGLILAAQLQRLGLKTLLVDKASRVGDTWRNRYRSLVLHDPIFADVFPYLEYPNHWPIFAPKDEMASWHEIYANAMQLNVVSFISIVLLRKALCYENLSYPCSKWNETTVVPGSTVYDEESHTWEIAVSRKDGTRRDFKCRHLVQATGVA